MKIIITEEQKKNLFIPRKQEGEDSKWIQWNKEQPIKDGVRINQYTHDGLKNGYWEKFYYNGKLRTKGNYINGERDSYWELYYDDGQLMSKGNYINGIRDGIWEYYYDNGQLSRKGNYINGNADGIWEYYHENGQLYLKELYKNGEYIKNLPLTESKLNEGRVKKTDRVKIYEDDKILVVVPLTHTASCKYGSKTPWCVSVPGTDEHFNEYTDNGVMVYFIIKSPYEYGDIKEYKFAYYKSFNKDMDEYNGWYDMIDYHYGSEDEKGSDDTPDEKLLKFLIPKKVFGLVINYINEQAPIYHQKILDKNKMKINKFLEDPDNHKIVDDNDWGIMYRDIPFGDDYQKLDWFPNPNKDNNLFIILINKKTYELYRCQIPFYIDIRTYKHSKDSLKRIDFYGLNDNDEKPDMSPIFFKYFKQIALTFFSNRKKYYNPRENDNMYMYPNYVEIGDQCNLGGISETIITKEKITGSYKPYKFDVKYPNGQITKDIYYNADLGVPLKYDKDKHNPTKI